MSTAKKLVDEVLKHRGMIRFDDGKIRLTAPDPLPESLCTELSEHKPEIIAYLTDGRGVVADGADLLPEWIDGVSRLSDADVPNGWPAHLWPLAVKSIGIFLNTWGSTAQALGWSTIDVFGAHKWAPRGRIGSAGLALSAYAGDVVLMLPGSAIIRRPNGARLTYRRRPQEADVVPVWELGG